MRYSIKSFFQSKRLIWACIIIFGIGAAGLTAFSYYLAMQFLGKRFYPKEQYEKTVGKRNRLIEKHNGQSVSIVTNDGLTLQGILFVRPNASRNLLLCHGWWMNKEKLRSMVSLFPDDNIFIFDFRAHGQSEGDMTSIGFYEKHDVMAAFDYLSTHAQTKHLPIYGLGISMGAASLIAAACQEVPFKGIVVDSTFRQLDEAISGRFTHYTGLPLYPFWPLCQHFYNYFHGCTMQQVNTQKWIEFIKQPVMFIHSEMDELAPLAKARSVFEKAKAKLKRLWVVKDSPHAVIFKRYAQEYKKRVLDFFAEIESKIG